MIKPTVGRVVLFHPATADTIAHGEQPLAAIITYVHSDTMLNLVVFDCNGTPVPKMSVTLLQDGENVPDSWMYCEWMPYQKGQAAKTEAAEAKVEALGL